MDSDYPNHLAHLFTSNIAPHPLEIVSIEQEIEGSTKMIEQLQQHLQKLERQRHGYRTLLSPVRRVPAEVLGEIFACVLEVLDFQRQSYSVGSWGRLARSDHYLMSLCLVCRAWRDAAFSMPRLWTNLEIRSVPSQLRLEKAFRWLDRCRGVPARTLTVYDDSRSGYYDNHQDCAKAGCKFSNPELARLLTEGPSFEKLVLCCESPRCFRALMAVMDTIKTEKPRPWDSMKSLDLYFLYHWDETDPSDSLFRTIPPVTSFLLYLPDRDTLEEDPSELDDALLHLGSLEHILTNLTTFTFFCNWDGTMILEALQMCHNLEDLTLDFQNWRLPYRNAPSLERVSRDGLLLPKLRALRIRNALSQFVGIIQFFKTPALAELDISLANEDLLDTEFIHLRKPPKNFPTIIRTLLGRSRCDKSLRKFRLDSVNVTSDNYQLRKILANFPYLTHLILDNVYFDPLDFNDSEGHHDERTTFIPRLEVLELLHLVPHFPLDDLQHFVQSRRKSGSPSGTLRKLVATLRKYVPPDFDMVDRLFIGDDLIRSLGFA